jgi:hypothetical protein
VDNLSDAFRAAKTPADFAAIQKVMADPAVPTTTSFETRLLVQLRGASPQRRKELEDGARAAGADEVANTLNAIDNAKTEAVQANLMNALMDHTQTSRDLEKAEKAAVTPADWAAIAAVYKRLGYEDKARRATQLAGGGGD